jgi:F-type H+-transporting ATPase subunit a
MDFVEILEHHLLDHKIAKLFTIGHATFYLTTHNLMMMIASAFLLGLLIIARRQSLPPRQAGLPAGRQAGSSAPTGWTNVFEIFIVYIRDEIVRPNLGEVGDKYLSYFLTLFFFILFCNLLGLVPFGATATGNIAVTAAMALTTFLMINIAGVRELGFLHYMQTYIPPGLPFWLVPLMFVIEILGLFTKSFALCIRLFANMIAGHIVILAFLGLIFIFKSLLIAPISVAAAVGLGLLELFVAFLQAYVFTLLTAVFVGGAVNPQH